MTPSRAKVGSQIEVARYPSGDFLPTYLPWYSKKKKKKKKNTTLAERT